MAYATDLTTQVDV